MKRKQLIALLLLLGGMSFAGTEWRKLAETEFPAGQNLRGFGPCTLNIVRWKTGKEDVVSYCFRTSTPEKAEAVSGKFIADLKQSHGIRENKMKIGKREVPVFVTSGGLAFCVLHSGTETTILGASGISAMNLFLANHPELAASAVASGKYPAYMDAFGWGLYGMGGFENTHGWMSAHKQGHSVKDPKEDYDFLKQMGSMYFDEWLDIAGFDTSDGLIKNNGSRWKTKYAEEQNIPFAYRVYVNAGGASWTARRFPEYSEQPAEFITNGWLRNNLQAKSNPHMTWYNLDIHKYLACQTMDMMKKYKKPQVRNWMHPHGELVHQPWYDMHADYSPNAVKHWQEYLEKRGVTLADASEMYKRGSSPFLFYSQIPVPEFATFAGLPEKILSLGGDWFYRRELDSAPKDESWWKLSPEKRYPGLAQKWYAPMDDLTGWSRLAMPGNEQFFFLFDKCDGSTVTTWFRRNFTYDPVSAGKKQVYLYFFPVSSGAIHSGPKKRYHEFFLNGKKAGEIGSWGALNVTNLLRKGNNDVAFHLHGSSWNGRIFLSTEAPKVFPYLGPARNRLWELWNEWRMDSKYDAWKVILDAMRQADPETPVKFMAPLRFGTPKTHRLAWDYGGWGHFTGEGMWFFPWYKRYGKLYGIPGTSELAGPADTAEKQFGGYRRTFLAGLDGHQPVFMTQTYSRNPEIRKWWLEHKPVLNRMGKFDIAGPQVLIYRSSWNTEGAPLTPYPALGKASRLIQSPWNWDIGRGSLQTLGQSYLYLDDDGIRDGKMYGYPLIVDCGNETMTPEAIAGLRKYVENGGTFVAFPFTGRNTRETPDSWPVRELTGCEVDGLRAPGGKVVFAGDQKLLPGYAGKTFADNGNSIDNNRNNLNLYSTELRPGKDCEVIAAYENGKPAIVVRRLGKGKVVTLGSVFWRGAQDLNGIWWPEAKETAFLFSLLNGTGFPAPLCETDDRLIWPQPYRSNNGLDFVSVLVNWHDEGTRKPRVTLRLPRKPERIISYGVDGIRELPFEWKNGTAVFRIDMPGKEVKVVSAEVYPAGNAIAHWWSRQQELWHELVPSSIDFSPYRTGKWKDPIQDLSEDARFTEVKPSGSWTARQFNDSAWKKAPLDIFQFWGAKENAPLWVRKTFRVNSSWLENGRVRLISGAWFGPHYQTRTRMLLNGKELHGFTKERFNEYDVTHLLNPGENVLAFEISDGEKYSGFAGNVFLYHRAAPECSFDLSGLWTGYDISGKAKNLPVPGKARLIRPAKKLFVPADWKGKYHVRLYLRGTPQSISGAWVNGTLVRRHHHNLGGYGDIDITGALRFGAENTLELAYPPLHQDDKLKEHDFMLDSARLDLFPVK